MKNHETDFLHSYLEDCISSVLTEEVASELEKNSKHVDLMHDNGTYFTLAVARDSLDILNLLLEYYEKIKPSDKVSYEYKKWQYDLKMVLKNAVETALYVSPEIQEVIDKYLPNKDTATDQNPDDLAPNLQENDIAENPKIAVETSIVNMEKIEKETEKIATEKIAVIDLQKEETLSTNELEVEREEQDKDVLQEGIAPHPKELLKVEEMEKTYEPAFLYAPTLQSSMTESKCVSVITTPEHSSNVSFIERRSGLDVMPPNPIEVEDIQLPIIDHNSSIEKGLMPNNFLKNLFPSKVITLKECNKCSKIHVKIEPKEKCSGCGKLHHHYYYKIPKKICYDIMQASVVEGYEFLVSKFLGLFSEQDILKQTNQFGHTVLHIAANSSKAKAGILEHILKKAPQTAVIGDKWGFTPLHLTVNKNDIEKTKVILEKMTSKGISIPTVQSSNYPIVHLEKEPSIASMKDKWGFTALHWAARNSNKELVKLILEKAPKSVSDVDNYNQTALHWAADRGNEEVVELLISRMSEEDILRESSEGYHKAICFAKTKILKKKMASLIQQKGIDFADEEGEYETEDLINDLQIMALGVYEIVAKYLDINIYETQIETTQLFGMAEDT